MNEKRRPGGRPSEDSAAAKPLELFPADDTRRRPQIAQEWDNRRLAERRMAPVPKPRTTTDDRTVWVEWGPKRTVAISGEKVFPAIKKLDIPYQWHPHRRDVLCIPVDHADDLITYFERRRRRRVEVVLVDRI